MPKSYKCSECREQMESKYKDTKNKTIWYCKKCDSFFGVEIPFKYTINIKNE